MSSLTQLYCASSLMVACSSEDEEPVGRDAGMETSPDAGDSTPEDGTPCPGRLSGLTLLLAQARPECARLDPTYLGMTPE